VALLSHLGLLLALGLAIEWLGRPLFKAGCEIRRACLGQPIARGRLALVGASAAGACLLAGFWLGAASRVAAPAVVEYAPLTIVRAGSPGFVREVLAADGQRVDAGQVIAVLENEELRIQWADLSLAIEQSELRGRIAHQAGEISKYQVEAARRESLATKREEVAAQLAALRVQAPAGGRLIARDFPALVGQYVEIGTQLAVIGDERRKELLVAIPQGDIDVYSAQLGKPVEARLQAAHRIRSQLASFTPRAQRELPHPALSARAGGPLPVRPKSADHGTETTADGYELLCPQFTGVVPLPSEQAAGVRAGQLATVRFRSTSENTLGYLLRRIRRWIVDRLLERDAAAPDG
jgi:putative peptide zinc metalloprotease protein